MNLVAPASFRQSFTAGTVQPMADAKTKLNRVFVKITDEAKRRLIHLSVDANASSVEEYAGKLLTGVVDQLWADFDPKKDKPGRKPKS